MNRIAIEVEGISKTFRSGQSAVKALDSVSFTVERGEIFGLLGPNGAGKTTLINIISGILNPDSGRASIAGHDCVAEPKKALRVMNVVSGYTGVPYDLTCFEGLIYYGMLYDIRDAEGRAEEVMREAGIEDYRDRVLEELSAGMKQNYMIARALLNRPEILILDEPTVGLDVQAAIRIRNKIKEFSAKGGTVLLTTHNMLEAEVLCDRVALISSGRIIRQGTLASIKRLSVSKHEIEIHSADVESTRKAIASISGIEIRIEAGRIVRVKVRSYAKIKEVLRAVSRLRDDVYSVHALEPTLEEAYLKLLEEGGQ